MNGTPDSAADGAPRHLRHKPPAQLAQPRELVLVCAPLRSNVNLSNMMRTAGCCGLSRVIACGNPKLDPEIARDGAQCVKLQVHRSLSPVLKGLREEGFTVIGLEQTDRSANLHEFAFPRKTALVVGNERLGLTEEELKLCHACVEIPVWGLPHSYNVATSAAMALYEYCKQYPHG